MLWCFGKQAARVFSPDLFVVQFCVCWVVKYTLALHIIRNASAHLTARNPYVIQSVASPRWIEALGNTRKAGYLLCQPRVTWHLRRMIGLGGYKQTHTTLIVFETVPMPLWRSIDSRIKCRTMSQADWLPLDLPNSKQARRQNVYSELVVCLWAIRDLSWI